MLCFYLPQVLPTLTEIKTIKKSIFKAMHRKQYITTANIHSKQKTCISPFVFHLIYVSLYLTGKNCFPALDNLIWLWCCLAFEYYSVSWVKVKDLQNQSKNFIIRAEHQCISWTFITNSTYENPRRMNHPRLPIWNLRGLPQNSNSRD